MQPHKRRPSDQCKTRRNRILEIVEHIHGLHFLFSRKHVQRLERRYVFQREKMFLHDLFITKFSLLMFVCPANQQYKIR